MPKQVDHAARRRELVEASWEVIASEGIEGTTLRKVAAAADCTTGRIGEAGLCGGAELGSPAVFRFSISRRSDLSNAVLKMTVSQYSESQTQLVASYYEHAVACSPANKMRWIDRHENRPFGQPRRI